MTTIHDVAKRAGVSPVTVSRVINGASNVNASTRGRVEQAIKELSYLPNLAARSLRSRQTSTLALIVPDITNAFWTTVARGVEDAAQREGYLVWLCNSDENLEKQNGYINAVLQQRVDGVMIAPFDSDANNLKPLRDLKTATVVIDREVQGWEVDTVRSDSISGAYALVQHLTNLGHRRIAIISGPSATSTAEERVVGYCLALEDAGIAIDQRMICRGEYRSLSGQELTNSLFNHLFDEALEPTAIVAANNLIGMGVFEALQARGKRVPQDIALVCFDELPDLARFYPFLTVAVQTAYDIGINAAQLLISRIGAEAPLQPRHVILPNRLLLRHSCGRHLKETSEAASCPPMVKDQTEIILIQPLPSSNEERIRRYMFGLGHAPRAYPRRPPVDGLTGTNRLRKALRHQSPDQLPHIETSIANRALLEYALERSLSDLAAISPADLAAFAQRVGLDAVACEVDWQPALLEGLPATLLRGKHSFPPPAFVEHFTRIEETLRATRASNVGVYISMSAFYDLAINAIGASPRQAFEAHGEALARWLDQLSGLQEQIIRSVCDRFAPHLEFLVIRDQLLSSAEAEALHPQLREAIFPRLAKVIQPAREHQLVVGIQSTGKIEPFLDDLYSAGVGLIQSIDPQKNHMPEILDQWQGKITFAGGFPAEALSTVVQEGASIEEQVRQYCQNLGNRTGVVFGVSPSITAAIRPEQYLRMVQAVRQFGKYERVE